MIIKQFELMNEDDLLEENSSPYLIVFLGKRNFLSLFVCEKPNFLLNLHKQRGMKHNK